jgi:hypothetical protein
MGVEMSELRWRIPPSRMILLATVVIVLGTYGFALVIFNVGELESYMVLALASIPLIMLIPYFLTKKRTEEVWHSPNTIVLDPSDTVIPKLERMLVGEGLSFTKRSETHDEGESTPAMTWVEVYEMSDTKLRLHISDFQGRTTVYIGPLRKDNRADVDELKGVVDKALD